MTPKASLAALALSGALLTALTACSSDDTEPVADEIGTDTATTTETPSTTPTGSPEPTSEATSEAPGTVAAPVYFTGPTPMGTRLYREFREVESDNPLEEAAALLVAGDALDPDYGTLLQGVTIQSVTQDADAIVVTLGDDSPLSADKGTSPKDAKLAVQSLVYTLQGVAGERLPVRTQLSDGSPADLYGQPTGEGVEAAPELDTLSLVSLTTPTEGATEDATIAIEGVASSFEATVPVAVRDSSGTEVLTDFATADGWVDMLYPFALDLDISSLDPGTYTLVARTDDPSGGEGPGPFEDTKTFVVE